MTAGYEGVRVTNLTTSWRNGLAFCALIHKHRPDLIGEWRSLDPHDTNGNCRRAFEAGDALGVPRVIEPADMDVLAVPDRLAVMTYLHQLRAHFNGKQQQAKDDVAIDDHSYKIGDFYTDTETHNTDGQFDREITELRNRKISKTGTLNTNTSPQIQNDSTKMSTVVRVTQECNEQESFCKLQEQQTLVRLCLRLPLHNEPIQSSQKG